MRGIIITAIVSLSLCSYAQQDCEQTLNQATEEFNAGHFYGIAALLKPCLDDGFTKEQRQRAYLLLTQTYLLLDDPIGAETSYLNLLYANPEFVAEPDREPIDVVYLSKKFTAVPRLSLFGRLGSNLSFERIINDWTMTGGNEKQQCVLRPGWQVNGGIEWQVTDNFSLAFEGGYTFTAFKKEVSNLFVNDLTEIYDRQHWLSLPISLRYMPPSVRNLKPYGYVGYSTELLLGARATLSKIDRTPNNETGDFSEERSESPILNFTKRRNFSNRSFILGAGVKYKVGLNYIFLDIRYSFGLSNITDEEKRYYDYSLGAGDDYTTDDLTSTGISTFEFANVDDDFRLDHLAFTFGYIKPIYKPRKLKKARTRTVLRIIKNRE